MSQIRNSANVDLYERERVVSENFESGARTKEAPQLYFCGLDGRKADAWTLVYMWTVPGSIGIPSGLLEKKLCFIMCCHFLGPPFWLGKNSFVQKVSKSFKKFRLFKFRRVPISVYTEIPLLLGSSLDVSEKVVTARHSLISFWQNEFQPTLICWFAVGTSYTGDPDWHIWWLRVGETSSVDNLCFALGVHLFCEFLRPLVSEFDGGSEFLIRNCVWASIFIHLIVPHISRYQLL